MQERTRQTQREKIYRDQTSVTDNSKKKSQSFPHSGRQILNQQQQKDKKLPSFSPKERREKGFPLSANQSGRDNGSHA